MLVTDDFFDFLVLTHSWRVNRHIIGNLLIFHDVEDSITACVSHVMPLNLKWTITILIISILVVVTVSFNAKMVLANFERNLKWLGTPRNGPEKVTCSLCECRGSGLEKQ